MALMLTMAIDDGEGDSRLCDELFIEPHVYRKPRTIDMGPVCAAAYAAIAQRQALGELTETRWRLSRPFGHHPSALPHDGRQRGSLSHGGPWERRAS